MQTDLLTALVSRCPGLDEHRVAGPVQNKQHHLRSASSTPAELFPEGNVGCRISRQPTPLKVFSLRASLLPETSPVPPLGGTYPINRFAGAVVPRSAFLRDQKMPF